MTKAEAKKAYKAGYALPSVTWPAEATEKQRTPGVHHCPFSVGDPQREEWLKGLKAALEGPKQDPASIIKEIDDEIKVASHAG